MVDERADTAMGPGGVVGQPASVLVRVTARLLDTFLAAVVGAVVVSVLSGDAEVQSTAWFAVVTLVVVPLAYHVVADVTGRQTLVKKLFRLGVRNDHDEHPDLRESLLRNMVVAATTVPVVGLVLAVALIITASRDERNRSIHDRIAGTNVRNLAPAPP